MRVVLVLGGRFGGGVMVVVEFIEVDSGAGEGRVGGGSREGRGRVVVGVSKRSFDGRELVLP